MALILTDNLGGTWALSVNAADQSLALVPYVGPPSPAGPNSITTTSLQLIEDAMQEIGALASGETPSNDDQAFVLRKLQRLLDRYNAREEMVYCTNFTVFTLPTNKQPISIGPVAADLEVGQRPVDIETIGLILQNSSPSQVEIWLNKRDKDWWAQQRVKNLVSDLPTDFYYEPDWPNGNLFLWPIPTGANSLIIQSRIVLTQITGYNSPFTLPPGYWDAIVYPLAVSLCPAFERQASADLLRLSMESIKAVQGNNIKSPRGQTGDAGMPGVGNRGDFNYLSGQPN